MVYPIHSAVVHLHGLALARDVVSDILFAGFERVDLPGSGIVAFRLEGRHNVLDVFVVWCRQFCLGAGNRNLGLCDTEAIAET